MTTRHLGFPAAVILLLGQALAAEPAGSPRALMEQGHWKRARTLVQARLAANPNDAEACFLMSRMKQAEGDLHGAEDLAKKAVSLNPKSAEYIYRLAEVHGDMAGKASFFSQISLARSFKSEAESALALDPRFVDALNGLIGFHLEAPGIVGGDKKKTADLATQITRIDPVRGGFAQARLALIDKDPARAEAALKQSVAADPRNYTALMALGNFYFGQQKYPHAAAVAKKALDLDDDRAGAYVLLANVSARNGAWAELDALLARAEAKIPDDLSPYAGAARGLLDAGNDLPRAEKYYRKYLSQEPELGALKWSRAHWRLGQVLEKEGRRPEAAAEYQQAIKLEPDFKLAQQDLKRVR